MNFGGWIPSHAFQVDTSLVELEKSDYNINLSKAYEACKFNKLRFSREMRLTTPHSIFGFEGEVPGL